MKKGAVIITRPVPQALSLKHKLQSFGHRIILLPTLKIQPVGDPCCHEQSLNRLTAQDIVIFVSTNAVNHALAQHTHLSGQIIAVGPATAQALSHHGLTSQVPELFTSEGILALPLLQKPAGRCVTIVSGKDSRPLMANILKQRGAKVEELICYERVKPKPAPAVVSQISLEPIDVIITTSMSGLNNLIDLINEYAMEKLFSARLLVISDKMQQRAQAIKFKHILLADNASDEAIIVCLNQYWSTVGDEL